MNTPATVPASNSIKYGKKLELKAPLIINRIPATVVPKLLVASAGKNPLFKLAKNTIMNKLIKAPIKKPPPLISLALVIKLSGFVLELKFVRL